MEVLNYNDSWEFVEVSVLLRELKFFGQVLNKMYYVLVKDFECLS